MKYAHIERERRWLVRSIPDGVARVDTIADGYIPHTRLRLREVTPDSGSASRKLGHKVRQDGARRIACTSIYLDDGEWNALQLLPVRRLHKRRHHVERDGLHVAVDELPDGTLLAEIDGGPQAAPTAPPWLDVIREVTDDEAWTGAGLVTPRSPWCRQVTGRLRAWRADDAPTVLAALGDDPALRRQLPPIADVAEAAGYCTQRTADHRSLAICVDGRAVGSVDLALRSRAGSARCSYWLTPGARRAGLATHALATLATWAFDDLRLHRLEVAHRPDDPASGRVAERAGFTPEGILRGELEDDGIRHDARLLSRLTTDPDPEVPLLPLDLEGVDG